MRLCAIAVCVGIVGSAHAVDSEAIPLLVAAEGEHAWVVVPTEPDTTPDVCRLVHFTSTDGPDQASVLVGLPRWPEAIASLDEHVWLVFPSVDAQTPNRDVLTLRVAFNQASERWFPLPSGHLEVLPSLSGTSAFGGIVPSDEGLFAVEQRAGEPWGVLRLAGNRWQQMTLPEGFLGDESVVVGRAGDGARRLPAIVRSNSLAVLADGVWSISALAPDEQPLMAVLAVEGTTLLARGKDAAALGYLRSGGVVASLATVEPIEGDWKVVAAASGPWLVEREPETTAVVVRAVDPISGVVGAPQEILLTKDVFTWLHLPLLGMVIIAAGIIVLVVRPFIERATADPQPGLEPLPVLRRAAGLIIDLIPGAVVAMLLFELTAQAFVTSFMAVRADQALPALTVVLVTVVHTGFAEVLWGTSFGKFVVGGKVVALNGEPATRLQRFLRVIAKGVVLLLPLMALLVFLEPLSRGMPELVSRTIVVRATRSEQPSQP